MLDISLELKGKGGEVGGGENTLAGCLRRSVEHLLYGLFFLSFCVR
jgi:hypothetical protein